MQTEHTMAAGDSAFQFWQPAMSTCAFPPAQKNKEVPIIPSRMIEYYGWGLAQLIIKIYFLGGRVDGLQLFTAPLVATN